MNVGPERVSHLSKITQQFGAGQVFDPDMSHFEASFFSHSGEVWLVRGQVGDAGWRGEVSAAP